ncbi:unnamed protein product [Closterium sp. Naga37s-1]|nr:unnamed protein product [Closterium sp. Naga37s-1]
MQPRSHEADAPGGAGAGGGGGGGTGPVLSHTYSGKLHAFLKSRTGQAPQRIEASPAEGKVARAMRKQIEEVARANDAAASAKANAASPPVRFARTFARKHRECDAGDGPGIAQGGGGGRGSFSLDDEPDWGALATEGKGKAARAGGKAVGGQAGGGGGGGGKGHELGREAGEDAEREAELLEELPALIRKAKSKDVGEVREAAEGFRDLSKCSERGIQFLCDAGGLIALLQMLGPGADEAATEHAVLTILNLSLSNKSIANRFLVSGALTSLSSVLCRSHNPSIRSNTAAAITALVARGGAAQVPSLHKQGTVRALLDLAEGSGEGSDGRRDALRALARLAGSEEVREEMVEEGGVELALRLAVSGDVDVLDEVAALLAQLGRTESGLRRIYTFRAQGKGEGEGEAQGEGQGEAEGAVLGVGVLVGLVVGEEGSSLAREMAAATLLRMATKGDEECRAAVVAAEGTLLPHLDQMAGDDSSQRLQTKGSEGTLLPRLDQMAGDDSSQRLQTKARVESAEGMLLPHLEHMAGDDSSQRVQSRGFVWGVVLCAVGWGVLPRPEQIDGVHSSQRLQTKIDGVHSSQNLHSRVRVAAGFGPRVSLTLSRIPEQHHSCCQAPLCRAPLCRAPLCHSPFRHSLPLRIPFSLFPSLAFLSHQFSSLHLISHHFLSLPSSPS